MLVYPDGNFIGTVGGGEMESRVIREALEALADRKSRKLSYSMVNPKDGDPGVCGGTVEIYVEPILGKPILSCGRAAGMLVRPYHIWENGLDFV